MDKGKEAKALDSVTDKVQETEMAGAQNVSDNPDDFKLNRIGFENNEQDRE